MNLYSRLTILGLTGFACMALGYFYGKSCGYREGCADTIEMYEWFGTSDKEWTRLVKNKKILDMFIEKK